MHLHFPYSVDGRGRTQEDDRDAYIRGLIEQVLFTAPGERVMRPDFGSGINQLLFEGNSPELAATTQMLVQGALQQWLGGLIQVESVNIAALDSTLQVDVSYVVLRDQSRRQASFERGVPT